jgi:hypothetical protein
MHRSIPNRQSAGIGKVPFVVWKKALRARWARFASGIWMVGNPVDAESRDDIPDTRPGTHLSAGWIGGVRNRDRRFSPPES